MRHQHLGVLDDLLVLFGGPYSNAEATEAMMDRAKAMHIDPRHMICTGDVVAYCGDPGKTIGLIRSAGCAVVAGNCERQLANGAPECGCGFEEGSACDLLSDAWYAYAAENTRAQDRAWMASLPDIVTFDHHGARYGVIHGGVSDVSRFVWQVSDPQVFTQEWELLEDRAGPVDHVIAGHSGLPFVVQTPKGRWINAGVIGMPPHDGGQQTRYAVLEHGEVRFEKLSYDVDGARTAMRAAGLADAYSDALRSGYWPSEDVLPVALRGASPARG